MAKKISILILDYLKSMRVTENVQLLQKQETDFDVEIIIVDNSCNAENRSKLETLREFGNVQLIFNERNLGYTRAYNRAAALASGDYLMIVNPDILVKDEHTLQRIVDYMEANPEIGVLGPRQRNDDGTLAMTVRAFPKLHIQVARRTFLRDWSVFRDAVAYDEMQHLNYEQAQDVDWLQSSFIVLRHDLWRELGGFSEKYWLFMSDPDLCLRAWERGHRVHYYPEVQVYADAVRCSAGGPLDFFRKWTLRQHLIDAIRYQLTHSGKKNPRLN